MNSPKDGASASVSPTYRRLVLASRSPRRRELLAGAGFVFEVKPSSVDEPAPNPGETAERYALRLAMLKARDVARGLDESAVVLGADTVVDFGGRIIGQPASDEEAREILRTLSGGRHAVVTGIALADGRGRETSAVARSELAVAPMSERDIEDYVSSGESAGKAGAYAIQESGDRFVSVLSGSLTNVVGLPMEALTDLLEGFAPDLAPKRFRRDDPSNATPG